MTSLESRSYCRVTVVAPTTRVDLALPADVPVADLLPVLADHTAGAGERASPRDWTLRRVAGAELGGGRTLRAHGVADGELLRLVPREAPVPPPVFDDVVDAIATACRQRISARSVNPGLAAAVIIATLSVAAFALVLRVLRAPGEAATTAQICAGIALASLGLAAALAHGYRNRILATALAVAGLPSLFGCGLAALGGRAGPGSVLLGAALCLGYALAAAAVLRTGTVVFAAVAVGALFAGAGALAAAHVDAGRAVAGTGTVALFALGVLPRASVRLARLPLPSVPTAAEDADSAGDSHDLGGDLDDLTARAGLAGHYLSGTQLGAAAVIGGCALALGVRSSVLSVALAAALAAALAMRARSVPRLAVRIGMLASAALAVLGTASVITWRGEGTTGVLLVLVGLALLSLVIATAPHRRAASPPLLRMFDFVESVTVVAVLPLAVGVLGLYSVLRHR